MEGCAALEIHLYPAGCVDGSCFKLARSVDAPARIDQCLAQLGT